MEKIHSLIMYFIASALTMQLQLVRCFSVWRLPVLYVFII